MAEDVRISGAAVRIRSPWAPILLSFLTLGIYGIVWYYKINKEMKAFGAAKGDADLAESRPGSSVLAVTLGAILVVPAIMSWLGTLNRVRRVQRLAGEADAISVGLCVVLTIFGLSVVVYYLVQTALNAAWRQERRDTIKAGSPAVPVVPQVA